MAKPVKHEAKREAIEPALPLHEGPTTLLERIDRIFGERFTPLWSMLGRAELVEMPAVDVYEEGGQVVLKAELPGLRKEEIEVEIAGDVVILSGKKVKAEKVEKKDYYRYERSAGAFTRTVKLPGPVEPEKATARLEHGVLELRAPRAAPVEEHAKKIAIT